MSIDGILNNISSISSATSHANGNNISEQGIVSQNPESSNFSSLLLSKVLQGPENKVDGYLLKTTGNIGSTINVVINDNGKVDLSTNKLLDAMKTPMIEIKSSNLDTAGYKNIFKLV